MNLATRIRKSTPSARAATTARWATTMTRWAIRFSTSGKRAGTRHQKRWRLVSFEGTGGRESRGIIDLMAIRRDHATDTGPLRPGDLFEIVFIQIKGGGARWPTVEDLRRMRAVQRHYRARAIVLAAWKKGVEPTFYVLDTVSANRKRAWRPATAADVFGAEPRTRLA